MSAYVVIFVVIHNLKCVCTYISRDIGPDQLEHTLLRVPIPINVNKKSKPKKSSAKGLLELFVTGQGRKMRKIRLSLKNRNVDLEKRYYA